MFESHSHETDLIDLINMMAIRIEDVAVPEVQRLFWRKQPSPPIRKSVTRSREWTPMFLFLLLISASYWYCLPIITQSLLFYNEFRGYDFLLLALAVLILARYREQFVLFLQIDGPGKWLYRLSLWATATLPATMIICLMKGDLKWPLVTLVFLFHLWGYLLAYAAIRMFITTRRQCLLSLDVFLMIGLVEAIIICLQAIGVLRSFWSQIYIDAYGEKIFNATLGPNRTVPGHVMVLVFAVATSYWRNSGIVGLKRIGIATMAAIASLAALGVSGSRTGWVTFLVFVIATSIIRPPPLKLFILVVVLAAGFMIAVPHRVANQIIGTYEWRIKNKLARASSDADYVEQFQQIDAGRLKLWVDGASELLSSPLLIPFGGGFNNYRNVISHGASAHNMYITLIAEVGVLGLLLYVLWLRGIWTQSSKNIRLASRISGRKGFLPVEIKALILALAVSLWGGEILYPYRPTFAFMGMFLFLTAVLNHRALVFNGRLAKVVPTSRLVSSITRSSRGTTKPRRAYVLEAAHKRIFGVTKLGS